jgi:ribonuclease HI
MVSGSIFCDGACSGNGTRRAIAGWGWAYWPGAAVGEPSRYQQARLLGDPATNQRAELMALLMALRWWREKAGGGPVDVYTDSMYAINCTSKWGASWKRKGWKRDSGEPLLNLDIIKPLVEIWRPSWRLNHVRGHQKGMSVEAWGNNWVDRAAVAGAAGDEKAYIFPPADDIPSIPEEVEVAPPVVSSPATKRMQPFDQEAPVPKASGFVANTIEHILEQKPAAEVKRVVPTGAVRQTDIRWFFGSA